MPDRAVILGAGALSLGFLGHQLGGEYALTFLDVAAKADLIDRLQRERAYTVSVAGERIEPTLIKGVEALRTDDPAHDAAIRERIAESRLFFTAVGVRNLDAALAWLAERLAGREDEITIFCAENGENVAGAWRKRLPPNACLLDTVIGRMCRIEPIATPLYAPVAPWIDWAVVAEGYRGFPVPERHGDRPGLHGALFEFVPDAVFDALARIKFYAGNGFHLFVSLKGRLRHADRLSDLADVPEAADAAREFLCEEIGPALRAEVEPAVGTAVLDDYLDALPGRIFSQTFRDTVARGVRSLPDKFAPNERIPGMLDLLRRNHIAPRRTSEMVADAIEVIRQDVDEHAAREAAEQLPDSVRAAIAGM